MDTETRRVIRDALITLGIEGKSVYSLVELEAVASVANEPLIAVMAYLRDRG